MKNRMIKSLYFIIILLNFYNLNAQDIYAGSKTKVERDIPADFPFESKFINLGTDTIHYVESGEGEPILLLHGLPAGEEGF